MRRFLLCVGLTLLTAGAAAAQTKISGVADFGKLDPQLMIPAGDGAGHVLAVGQRKCTWSTPLEVNGEKSKEGVSTASVEVMGNTSRTHGFHVTTTDAGDKYYVSFQGTAMMKDGVEQSEKGTWMFTGRTGKLKAIKGKGTYNCTQKADGFSCEVEGETTP